jgi:hypothetical protein
LIKEFHSSPVIPEALLKEFKFKFPLYPAKVASPELLAVIELESVALTFKAFSKLAFFFYNSFSRLVSSVFS